MDNMAGLGTSLPERPAKGKGKKEKVVHDEEDEEDDPDFDPSQMAAQMGMDKAALLKAMTENRGALMSSLQGKLDSLIGQSSGYIESLPQKVQARVRVLNTLQESYDDLETKFKEEKAALVAKYNELYKPIFAERSEIVAGRKEVELTEEEKAAEAEEEEEEQDDEDDSKKMGIPEFWLRAMKNHDMLEEQITERDEAPLKYLVDIISDKELGDSEQKGFRLHFHFLPNPYFENTVLSKSYFMMDEDDPILEKAEGTEIKWKAGKNVTVKVMKKKPKKGGKNAKPITKTEPCESFFNFFSPPQVPDDDEDLDDEDGERLQEEMEADYEMGSILRERVIPRAVAWFTGEAAEELEDEDDEDDEDDSEGDGDDDDEEEDDEAEEPPKAKGKAGKAAGAPADGAPEQPPECKQQ